MACVDYYIDNVLAIVSRISKACYILIKKNYFNAILPAGAILIERSAYLPKMKYAACIQFQIF